ncbi:ZIP zinc transporter-domain-containing protein [Lipomyces japonicus]|uniref:ZIP zinc transporter-domain-containing protein n=1 Tax=Lipomyces japonicus TaxID=56871 RepID=UPI0034CDC118
MFRLSIWSLFTVFLLLGVLAVSSAEVLTDSGIFDLEYIEDALHKCGVVQELDKIKSFSNTGESSVIEKAFGILFPFGPGLNAILATAYISGPPNLFLALIPPNIDPSSLSILVSFAVGGLLGDVFFHLLPQTFLGESHDSDHVSFVLVEEHRNSLLGLAIFFGFAAFIVLDKSMRIFSGEGGHDHSHNRSHSSTDTGHSSLTSVSKPENKGLRNRKNVKESTETERTPEEISKPEPAASVKLSAYLNLIADFSHNITDGLAIAASFYVSAGVGATTTLAVFFHEIPHEVGDFALLIQGGFSKSKAMGAQFITAIGAFLGTFIGIAIQYLSTSAENLDKAHVRGSGGLFGTTVIVGDLVLPFTAGGFLYIATVGVIPEILETDSRLTTFGELKKGFWQAFAMLLGAGMMLFISWTEA